MIPLLDTHCESVWGMQEGAACREDALEMQQACRGADGFPAPHHAGLAANVRVPHLGQRRFVARSFPRRQGPVRVAPEYPVCAEEMTYPNGDDHSKTCVPEKKSGCTGPSYSAYAINNEQSTMSRPQLTRFGGGTIDSLAIDNRLKRPVCAEIANGNKSASS